jgi:acetyl-CoA carboxylase biotin carboxylase subunit
MTFIGPDPIHMQTMGDKVRARRTMEASGVPVRPGTGVLTSAAEAIEAAERIGLPVILKASAGGGGRGMKIIRDMRALPSTLETAQLEAFKAFGNGDMYLERYVTSPRHVEVQVVADKLGDAIHLLERECSVQRRHQKVLEEAPCAVLDENLRAAMCAAAVKACKAINYHSLGTLEFLLDGDRFYFMEMNTRVQVEHCVTEMITGIDLVQEQIRLATGEPLAHLDREHKPRGHAIECRINAEDPVTFAPRPGTISALHFPGGFGVRVDSHCYTGYTVSPHYDSMVAKLIVHAPDRPRAISRMRRALGECVIEGLTTNLPLHRWLLKQEAFVSGKYDTHFLEANLDPEAIRSEADADAQA